VIDPSWLATVDGVGKRVALTDRHRRKIDPVGDIANRVDIRQRCARIFVNLNAAAFVNPDIQRFDPKSRRVGTTADRKHHLVAEHGAAIG